MSAETTALKAAIAFALENDPAVNARIVVEPVSLQAQESSLPAVFLRSPRDRLKESYDAPRWDKRTSTLEIICLADFGAVEEMPTVGSLDDLEDAVQGAIDALLPSFTNEDVLPPIAAFLLDWQYVETVRIFDVEGNRQRVAAVIRYEFDYCHYYLDPDDFEALEFGDVDYDLVETTATPPDASDQIAFEQ